MIASLIFVIIKIHHLANVIQQKYRQKYFDEATDIKMYSSFEIKFLGLDEKEREYLKEKISYNRRVKLSDKKKLNYPTTEEGLEIVNLYKSNVMDSSMDKSFVTPKDLTESEGNNVEMSTNIQTLSIEQPPVQTMIDLSSDSTNDEMSNEGPNEGETPRRQCSVNSSSARSPKRQQLYLSDSEEDSEG